MKTFLLLSFSFSCLAQIGGVSGDWSQALVEVASQVPALAVLVALTIMFMRYMAQRDATIKTVADTHAAAIKDVTDIQIDQQEKCRQTIQENTRTLGKVDETLDRITAQIDLARFRQ